MPHGILAWESRELVIPLDVSVAHWRTPDYVGAAAPRVQPIIQSYLCEAARDGWRPDEPTDFATLFSRSRVRTRDNAVRWSVVSAAIRLTRGMRIT
jgi:hypothetical protein